MSTDLPPQGRPRYQLLDIARGVAILAMVVFHVAWDLYYFGYVTLDVTADPGWVVFQKSIVTAFLLLVGAGLVLAHGNGIRWRPFWRRFAFLAVAAALVTAGTYWMFPDYFVFFGVLHAIALFSLMALPFVRLDGRLVLLAGIAVVAVSFAYTSPLFIDRTLAWIGFWTQSPPTSDVVPVFPWFGVVLIGMGAMRLILASPAATRIVAVRSTEPFFRGLAFLGRWSLPFYLLHQPVIIGILYGLMQLQAPVLAPPVSTEGQAFIESCVPSCEASGRGPESCQRYCQCAYDEVEKNHLSEALAATPRSAETEQQLAALTKLCTAMAD